MLVPERKLGADDTARRSDLDLPPADFAQLLADRERMTEAEENVRVYLGGKPEHVVPLKRRKK